MSSKIPFSNWIVVCAIVFLSACASQSKRVVETDIVASAKVPYSGPRTDLIVGNFQNRSSYAQGLFSNGDNKLGNQAKTILKAQLQQTNRFNVMDRENMEALKKEAELAGVKQSLVGANYVVSGDVTQFGRKVTGDKQLFGILGRGKEQVAYASVTLNVVDVRTSAIVYSTQGAGEYALGNREVIGFGGTAGYDATLNGKVLNFAITKAVDNLVSGLEANGWGAK